MIRIFRLISVLIFLLISVSCLKIKKNEHIENATYNGDPLEKSAFLKKDLPWFARYQLGDAPVVGFPGETPEEKKKRMQKWVDSKYGLFLHWGPQQAGGEYLLSNDALAQFNPTDFNADEWVLMAKRLGFKYMVITTKHHAGFSLFDSKYTDHDIIDATPFKRDPIKELADACTRHNFLLGFYYSVWDIHHPDYSGEIGKPRYKYYQEYMLNQIKELFTNYGPIFSLWLDGEWVNSWTVERAAELRKTVRELQPNTIIVNRLGQRRKGDGDYDSPENYMPYIGNQEGPWEGCAKFDGGWFYNGTNDSKSPEWVLYNLCYATSRGGNFLMNLGPTPKGRFLDTSIEKLEQVGEWLQVNGESIYEAQKGPHYLLEWGTSTQKDNILYYQVFDWPEDGKLIIPGLNNIIKSASFLADKESKSLIVKNEQDNVVITMPKLAPYPMANVIKVELESIPKVDNAVRAFNKKLESTDFMREVPTGGYFFSAGFANIHGEKLHYFYGTGAGAQRENLKGWTEKSDWAEWDLLVEKDESYSVEITYANLTEGGVFELTVAGQTFEHTVKLIAFNPKAKQSPLIVKYKTFELGEVNLKPGRYKLTIKPIKINDEAKKYHQGLMTFRDVTLVPK
jgi:alpha-L-fucosidase